MNSFIVDCGVYPFDILVFFGENREDLFKDLKDRVTKEDFKWLTKTKLSIGKSLMLKGGQTVLWLKKKPSTARDFGILNHEIFHCANFVLSEVGIEYSEQTEEAYAYFIEYITIQIFEELGF